MEGDQLLDRLILRALKLMEFLELLRKADIPPARGIIVVLKDKASHRVQVQKQYYEAVETQLFQWMGRHRAVRTV